MADEQEVPVSYETISEDITLAEPNSYQEAREAALRRQEARAEIRDRTVAKLEVQAEIEGNWFTNLFADSEEGALEDDGFVDNTLEVVLSGGEVAIEQVVRTVGDISSIYDLEEDTGLRSGRITLADPEFIGEDEGIGLPFTDARLTYLSGAEFKQASLLYEISTGRQPATLSSFEIPDQDRPDSAAGQMGQAFMQFAIVFAATRRAMTPASGVGTAGQIGIGFAAGGVADFAAFDPHEARLSDLLTEIGEGDTVFNNAVTQYLAADELDSALEGRLKNAIEGSIVGGTFETVFMAIKWLRVRRQTKVFNEIPDDADTILKVADEVIEEADAAAKTEIGEAADAARAAADETKVGETRELFDEDVIPESTPASKAEIDEVIREDVGKTNIEHEIADKFRLNSDLAEATIENLARQIGEGNYAEAGKLVNFNEARIDWANMEDGDNLKQLFIAFENAIDPMIKEATSGVVPLAQTKRMGQLIGASAEESMKLFGDLKGHGGISARMFAAHQTMVASGGELLRLARNAKKTGSPEDLFAFHRHIELHAGIMAMVKGSQTEIARALSAMRLMKSAAAESFKEFEEIKRLMTGHKDSQSLIDGLLINPKQTSLIKINAHVHRSTGRKISDIIAEVAINGLLSSPKTHVINLTSNVGMSILAPMERYIAAGVGAIRGTANAKALIREANAALIGQLRNTVDAARLAGRAFLEGKPISDLRQRVEFDARKQIKAGTGQSFVDQGVSAFKNRGGRNGGDEIVDSVIQRAINTIGNTIRIPGRLLLAGDEFFKSINKQGELHAQAYRLASEAADAKTFKSNATRQAWVKNEMRRRVQNPTPDMEAHAVQTARRNTFQETPETAFGPKVEGLLNFHPLFKLVVAPFVRTPLNLIRQAFVDRNPILAFFVKKNRQLVAAGGREGDAVIARTVSGVGLMMGAYGLASSGIITGKGEHYTSTEKLDRIPDYSIKFGDRYIAYSRIDPVGSILGLVADVQHAMELHDPNDPESLPLLAEFAQATGLAYMTGAMNKTWMKSMSDLMETATQATEGSGSTAKRKAEQFAANQLIKAVPFSSGLRGATQSMDPVVREAWTIRDRVFRSLPGLSEDLPPVRDLLGRPVTRDNAQWFWINPFGANPESDNPVDQELARLSFDVQPIPKNIDGVQLNSTQYSRIKELVGKLNERDPGFEAQLAELFADPSWQDIPTDAMRVRIVKDMLSSRISTAKNIFTGTDTEFRKAFLGEQLRESAELSGADLSGLRQQLGLDPQ